MGKRDLENCGCPVWIIVLGQIFLILCMWNLVFKPAVEELGVVFGTLLTCTYLLFLAALLRWICAPLTE